VTGVASPSPDDTVITQPGQSLVGIDGTVYEIATGGAITANRVVDAFAKNVIQMAYVKGVVWEEDSSARWYSKTFVNQAWSGPFASPLTTTTPVASSGSTQAAPPPPPSPAPALSLAPSAGNGQSGTVGATLAPLTVTVADAGGTPLPGLTVAFDVTAGGGKVSTGHVRTNAAGQASTTFTLGLLAGSNTVTASVAGSTAVFTETGLAAPAQHVDYFVSQAPGASDANDGRSATFVSAGHGPWLTIGHACSLAQAGDIVHVAAGTYTEDVTIANSGTQAAPVRIYSSAIGVNPVVLGSFTITGRHYVEVRGFTVVGPKTLPGSWQDMPAVVIDSPGTTIDPSVSWTGGRQSAVEAKYATYTKTVNDVFYGASYSAYSEGFSVIGSSYVTIAENTVSLHTIGIMPGSGSSQVTIDRNDVFHCCTGIKNGSTGSPPFFDSVISRNHCHQNLVSGIELASAASSITVEENLCEYNALCQFALNSGAASCVVRNNVGRFGGYYAETMQVPGPSAFDFFEVGSGNVVDGNLAAFQVDVTLVDGSGFIADTSSYPITFTNNVAFANEGRGISLTKTSSCRVINNTLAGNGYLNPGSVKGAGLSIYSSTGNTIENNVFAQNHYAHVDAETGLSSQVMDYNLYAPGLPLARDTSVFYDTIASLRATGKEAHGIDADPRFVDATTDFHPASGSPAIGAASVGVAPKVDFLDFARGVTTDIGAIDH
jgi:parallel beta-helix repeat protein